MRAVVVSDVGQLELTDVPEPVPDGRALVRVQHAGLCGTDVKILEGGVPVAYPRVLGHELVGEVVEPGSARRLTVGERVLVDPTVACGHCWLCRHDRAHLCGQGGLMGRDVDGGFADYVAVGEGQLLPIPDGVDSTDAAVLQILGTCVHGQRRVEAFPGQTAVVVGLGVSGLLHLQLLRLRGFDPVVGVSRSPHKRELGRRLGAAATATPEEAGDAVREALGERGPDLVVESAGTVPAFAQAVDLSSMGGTVLAYGTISASQGELPYYEIYYKELSIIGARAAGLRDYERGIELAAAGRLRLAPLVTDRYRLDQAPEAFDVLRSSDRALKVVLDVPG
ncbi:MAG: zinc-dependent alcohol dehydrogenase [bacterium]